MNRSASILQRHYENPTHVAWHWAVAVLGLFAGLVHLYLNVPLRIEGSHFTLNGLGYFILLIAFLSSAPFIPAFIDGQRKLLDYTFMGYAAAAIVAWVFIGKPYSALGYSTTVAEVLLIVALWWHSRGISQTVVPRVSLRTLVALAVAVVGLAVLLGAAYASGRTTVPDIVKAESIVVDMKNTQFLPSQVEVTAGEATQVVLKNSDLFVHTFTIEELGIDHRILFGNEKLVELPALEPGEYTYICTVPGHESMTGTLVVSESL